MGDVLSGFFTIWFVIGIGWLMAHLKVLDHTAQGVLSKVSFYVGLPALLFSALRVAELERIFSLNVIVSALAIFITLGVYLVLASTLWKRDWGHRVIGGFCSCYVNANNMGLPIAAYVLQDTSWVAPILLIQVIFLQPVGLSILDALVARRHGQTTSWWYNVSLPLRNPMTLGVAAGLVANLLELPLPGLLLGTIDLVAGISVPAMLVAFGISLRTGPLPGRGNVAETISVSALKVIFQPLVGFLLARFVFGLDPVTTLAVTVMAGLPTAQNVFVFAMRGDQSVQLARDVIFITSLASIPAVTAMAAVVNAAF
ncbi:MAG: AEC family transporter [Brooklawnia sp.]|uniref:AEC family transporter n=1 Tax=Brooklawnia sp. TaxID=2699740 RepID=UPI003C71B1FE